MAYWLDTTRSGKNFVVVTTIGGVHTTQEDLNWYEAQALWDKYTSDSSTQITIGYECPKCGKRLLAGRRIIVDNPIIRLLTGRVIKVDFNKFIGCNHDDNDNTHRLF